MKKIKLDLDQLKVNSFETSKTNSKSGTVKGNIPTMEGCTDDLCLSFYPGCPQSRPIMTCMNTCSKDLPCPV